MNSIPTEKTFVVIIVGDRRILINSKEFENLDIHMLLNSNDIKVKFYNKLPIGLYEFKGLTIYVNEIGEINVLNEQIKRSR